AVGMGIFPDPALATTTIAPDYDRTTYPRPEGDVFFDNDYSGYSHLSAGGYGLEAMIHEIGHALGLKHPHDDGGNGRPTFTQLGSAYSDVMVGNDANNVLTGGTGDDNIDGGAGADRMVGGTGGDYYTVDSPGDVVVENPGEGIDTITSIVSTTLPSNVEKLVLAGTAAINGTGNDLDNTLTGNDAANVLDGGPGADFMDG